MSFTGVLREGDLDNRALLTSSTRRKYVYSDFRGLVQANTCDTPYGAPTGTAGDVNNIQVGDVTFQNHVLGTQTILAPSRTATGLNITQDLTNNDGIEYTLGCESPANTVIGALSPATFTVGTDKPFAASLKFKLADVSGTDDCAFGFRKMEAYQANIDDYNDMAVLNAISGDIKIETILANAATTTTDTTLNWADGETHTLTVIVDSDGSLTGGAAGRVFYEVDGVKPTTTAAFTFASGTVLIPFFYFLNDADVAETTELIQWETGFHPISATTQFAAQGTSTNPGA